MAKPKEIQDQASFLDQVDKLIKNFKNLTQQDRRDPRRMQFLCRIRGQLAEYQEQQMALQVTLKQMRQALDQEIEAL